MISPRLVLYVAALISTIAMGPHAPVYWDSWGYVSQSMSGQVGGLALGRPLFVLVSHALTKLYLTVGGNVWTLEPMLRSFWIMVSAFAAPLTHALAERVGLTPRAALLAGAVMATAPSFAHSSDAVLTDAPAVVFCLLSFVLAASAVKETEQPRRASVYALLSGVVLGVAFGVREQSVTQLLVLALMLPTAPRGARLRLSLLFAAGFVVSAAAPLVYVINTQRGYVTTVRNWVHSMQRERAEKSYRLRDLLFYLGWLSAAGPPMLLAALWSWRRNVRVFAERWTLLLAVCVPSMAQLLLLGMYQDIAYSPRYLLTTLPGAIAIPAAYWLDQVLEDSRARLTALGVLLMSPIAVSGPLIRRSEAPLIRAGHELPALLRDVPPNATVVTGQLCLAVEVVRRQAYIDPRGWGRARPAWQRMCPGWDWPHAPEQVLDRVLAEGRVVVLDLRNGAWLGPGQQATQRQMDRYAQAHREDVVQRRIIVWR